MLAIACFGDPPATERGEPALLAEPDSAEVVASELTSALRRFIDAIAVGDSAALKRSVAIGASAVDLRSPTSAAEPLGYFRIMAGELSARLNLDDHTYFAIASGGPATVYAIGARDALRTTWQPIEGGWAVTHIVIMRPSDARANLERERAQSH